MTRQMLTFVLATTLLSAVGPLGCAAEGDPDDLGLVSVESRNNLVPIIFVHGCTPPDATDELAVLLFEPMIQTFIAQGYPENYMVRFLNKGAQCTSNVSFALQLAILVAKVQLKTHSPKVDIVAHSMGALAARLYMRTGGAINVRRFVSVAGANHGTNGGVLGTDGLYLQDAFGGFPWFEGFQEMYPPYACQGQTFGGSADIQFIVNGCLTPTGRTTQRDETPGNVGTLSIRNTEDEIVNPVGSACLNQRFQNDCADSVNTAVTVPAQECFFDPTVTCEAHLALLWDPAVIGMTYEFLTD